MANCIYCKKPVEPDDFVEIRGGWFRVCKDCQKLLKEKGENYLEELYYEIEGEEKDKNEQH